MQLQEISEYHCMHQLRILIPDYSRLNIILLPNKDWLEFYSLFSLTSHCPPPLILFHHFSLSTCSRPPSCSCRIALVIGVRYGESEIVVLSFRYLSISRHWRNIINLPTFIEGADDKNSIKRQTQISVNLSGVCLY